MISLHRGRLAAIFAPLLVALALAGCGGGGDDDSAPKTAATQTDPPGAVDDAASELLREQADEYLGTLSAKLRDVGQLADKQDCGSIGEIAAIGDELQAAPKKLDSYAEMLPDIAEEMNGTKTLVRNAIGTIREVEVACGL